MGLETGSYIGDLVVTNPVGATDALSTADDHLRLIKTTVKGSLPGFTGVILGTGTEAQGGTVNDFGVTLSPAPAAYATGATVLFFATHANTAASVFQ